MKFLHIAMALWVYIETDTSLHLFQSHQFILLESMTDADLDYLCSYSIGYIYIHVCINILVKNIHNIDISVSMCLVKVLHECLMYSYGPYWKQLLLNSYLKEVFWHWTLFSQTGAMRLGKDALVITQTTNSRSIAFLSQSLNEEKDVGCQSL